MLLPQIITIPILLQNQPTIIGANANISFQLQKRQFYR